MSEHETRPDDDVRADEREELEDRDYVPGGKRRKGRGLKGCLAVLVALVVLLGGFYVALTQGVSWVADQFQGPEDYPGPGKGSVEFTVNEGDVVAIWGAGPIGQMCADFALMHKASRVIMVDQNWRLEFIKERYPKIETVDFSQFKGSKALVQHLKEICDGRGPDVALECVAG